MLAKSLAEPGGTRERYKEVVERATCSHWGINKEVLALFVPWVFPALGEAAGSIWFRLDQLKGQPYRAMECSGFQTAALPGIFPCVRNAGLLRRP